MLKSMLTRLRETRESEVEGEAAEAGFTLIELMVVLLIIAILLAIAIPTFLGVSNSAGDRAAQSNLTNALTEAKALYQNGASYAGQTPATFSSQAPEFQWVQAGPPAAAAGGCSTGTCLSMQIVDVVSSGDGQGIVLAAYSTKSQQCWYAVDLENTPVSIAGDSAAFINATQVPTSTAGAWTAGVFYGKKVAPTTATNCNADWAMSQSAFKWGTGYSNAPAGN